MGFWNSILYKRYLETNISMIKMSHIREGRRPVVQTRFWVLGTVWPNKLNFKDSLEIFKELNRIFEFGCVPNEENSLN